MRENGITHIDSCQFSIPRNIDLPPSKPPARQILPPRPRAFPGSNRPPLNSPGRGQIAGLVKQDTGDVVPL
jgi:hypothetical protein